MSYTVDKIRLINYEGVIYGMVNIGRSGLVRVVSAVVKRSPK